MLQLCGMLHRLKEKWNVSWTRFSLIFLTFALGGSACARAGNLLLSILLTEKNTWYWIIYVPLISLLWPVCVLAISIPLGQFRFFKNYLSGVGRKLWGKEGPAEKNRVKHIAIFASGAGSNARKIIEYFEQKQTAKVVLIVCNNPGAGVLNIAASHHIPVEMVTKKSLLHDTVCLNELRLHQVDLVVLAGFLWMIPRYLIEAYPGKIINIHPALLPKYGGKGMYGVKVHEAVIAAGETESGITIHYVDEHYDNGDVIFQATCAVAPNDTAQSLAEKVHALEHAHFPRIVEQVLMNSAK